MYEVSATRDWDWDKRAIVKRKPPFQRFNLVDTQASGYWSARTEAQNGTKWPTMIFGYCEDKWVGCLSFLKKAQTFRLPYIDVIAILSARKAKSRAQLTTMRTTVAYSRTKHCFMLDYHSIANAFHMTEDIDWNTKTPNHCNEIIRTVFYITCL